MKLLTKSMQQDMAVQMCNKARDIDICCFNALDGSMPKDYLLDCLTLYETADGGYGHGLHIDNYNTNASPYQVYEALRMLDMLDFDSSCNAELYEPIIGKCFNYLYNRAEIKDNCWNANVKSNDDFAHAKIYSYTEENKQLFGYHPTAAILGYTLTLCKPTKAYYKKALRMIDSAISYLYKTENLTKMEAVSFASLLNSLKKAGIKKEEHKKMEEILINYALKNVSLDFEDDNLHPSDIVLNIEDERLNEMKEKEADYLVSSVKSFGLWDYKKDWGWTNYPEADSASLKWIGAITVNNYYILKKYGRIE